MDVLSRPFFTTAALRPLIWLVLVFAMFLPGHVRANFGLSENSSSYIVNTGAGLVFHVNKSTGDIRSLVYNGIEYQSTDRGMFSHIASGFGSAATVRAKTFGDNAILITSEIDRVTHYMMARNGETVIHMATYLRQPLNVGELRWITRLRHDRLPHSPVPSDLRGNIGAFESGDVFEMPDGTIRSKYYGDEHTRGKDRAFEMTWTGIKGENVGVWMVFDNRESSAGGPFFRDIQNQNAEVYNYMNSGHNQTEAVRTEVLHGPYSLVFNNGAEPALPIDYSWIESTGVATDLLGWTPASQRGRVGGNVSGMPDGFEGLVGFSNPTAQHWAEVTEDGTFLTPLMKAGTYPVTLYRNELSVATAQVSVVAGQIATLNLAATEPEPADFIFRIGDWDGTPAGFRNADKIIRMHPGDVRMEDWTGRYVVEENAPSTFPAIQMRGVNSPAILRFFLTAQQASQNRTLRIGMTAAYNNGRPHLRVNNTWSPSFAPPPNQPSSRSFTLGTYRGNNATYSFSIPASALREGINLISIEPISGSSDLSPWLSAGWVYDAIQLDGPPTSPITPRGLAAAAGDGTVTLTWQASPSASRYIVRRASEPDGPFETIAANAGLSTFTDTGAANGQKSFYQVIAQNSAGQSSPSATVNATPLARVAITDPGFDAPSTVGVRYNPTGGAWKFTIGSGVAAQASSLASENPAAPDTFQVAFLQDKSRVGQIIDGFVAGQQYAVTISGAQLNTSQEPQTFTAQIDGAVIGTFSPPQTATDWADYTAVFTATGASHILSFSSEAYNSTILLNNVRIRQHLPDAPAALTWTGSAANNTWDTETLNWNGGTAAFSSGATVVFDDSGYSSGPVGLEGDLQPAAVVVNASSDYVFEGSSGSITGSAELTKQGAGTLSLGGDHSFSGAINVEGGSLFVGGMISGFNAVSVDESALLRVDGSLTAGSIHNAGTIRITGDAVLQVSGTFINDGLLDLLTWSGTLPPGLINNGTIIDATTALRVRKVEQTESGEIQVTIHGYPGYSYQLQIADSLTTGSWTNAGSPQSGQDAPLTFTAQKNGDRSFYRVAVGSEN